MAFLLENGYFLKNKFFFNYFSSCMCYLGQKNLGALVSKKNFDGNPLNRLYPPKGGGGGGEAKN